MRSAQKGHDVPPLANPSTILDVMRLTLPLHDSGGFDLDEDVGVEQSGHPEQR